MKFVPFRDSGSLKTYEIVNAVVTQAQQGVTVDEIRRRCRIIDAVERAAEDGVLLEDADHDLLRKLVSEFRFGMARPDLLQIIDDILQAQAPLQAVA